MARVPKPRTVSTKQARIAGLARQMPETALFSLSHHVDIAWMHEAYRRTRKDGAAGIDGVTAKEFEQDLEANLQALLDGFKTMEYRAPPVRRVEIPKPAGGTRSLGIPTLADKVLQRAVQMLLEPLYEQDFYDLSYGFRPNRSAHQAIDALDRALFKAGRTVWVLEVDVKSFFDTIDHQALRDLLRLRVADGPVVRSVGKWLRAGVLADGVITTSAAGTPQGGVISPLLSNIYLHHVLDTWWVKDVLPRMRGTAKLVRYADDFVMVFEREDEALKVQETLSKRFSRFGLTLHPEKTRLIRFTPPSDPGGRGRGSGFDFLGFTFFAKRNPAGGWFPRTKTSSKSTTHALRSMDRWLRRNRHRPIPEQHKGLETRLRGHFGYFGIQYNLAACWTLQWLVGRRWRKWLNRRSQRRSMTWSAFNRLLKRYPLPRPRVRPRAPRSLWTANL